MKGFWSFSIIATALLAGSFAWAGGDAAPVENESEYSTFAGINIGGVRGLDSTRDIALGLRGGVEGDLTRIFFSSHYFHYDNADSVDMMLNLEATTPLSEFFFDSVETQAFVGGHFGTVFVDLDNASANFEFAGGVQGGLLFDFDNSVGVEMGYRHTWSNWKNGGVALKHYSNIYTGINVKF